MKATFENTVSILVKAYLNDTLQNMNCCACAVGNMVADACGYTYKKAGGTLLWNESVYPTFDSGWYGLVKDKIVSTAARSQINAVGYTIDELARIESKFEQTCDFGGNNIFDGLMAVVDVLAEIHNVDLSVKESAKLQFVRA